jgi:hypothetical protein
VLFNMNPEAADRFWLTTEYLPAFIDLIDERYRAPGTWEGELRDVWGERLTIVPMPIPHDCLDGFYGAYWRRPEAYLDPRVRAGISVFAKLPARHVERGIARLRAELASGAWHERHADLRERAELDLGYVVVVAELGG